MTCEEVMEYMQRQLDGDLNGDEQKKLNDHLANCPECARMMDRLMRIDQDLANLPKVVPAYSLVDAILPRLEQVDEALRAERPEAAARAHSAPGGERPARSWYARRGWMRYGGLAAAAVVLGVLVVNGLIDSFDQSRSSMQESASSGSSSPERFSAATGTSSTSDQVSLMNAPEFGAAADSSAGNSASDDTMRKGEKATDAPAAPAAAPDEPISKGSVEPSASYFGSEEGGKGPSVGVSEAGVPPAAAHGPAQAAETPQTEAAEVPKAADADAAGEPEMTLQSMVVADQYGAPVYSEDGGFAAEIRITEDGMIAVHIDQVRNGTAENRYVSGYRWEAGAAVEVIGWNGTTVTYTVRTENEVRTFTIDAATGAESEIS